MHDTSGRWVRLLRTYGIVIALLILVVIVAVGNPGFLNFTNLMNISSQWAPAGIMAVGMTLVIITGGFDLSVGAIYSLTAVIAAAAGQHYSAGISFTLAILAGLFLGLVNGGLVTIAQVNPFIATLGTSFAITGIALVATGNIAFVVDNPEFSVLGAERWNGIPYSGMLLAAFLIIGGLVLWNTTYGKKIYAVGGNAEASRLAGIHTRWITASTYVISGGCAGVAGVITASQLSSAQPYLNSTIVFDVITVVVVGGTSLAGGYGAMWRTAVGLGILATLQNGFNLLNVDPYYQTIIKGVIIVAALALDSYAQRLAARAASRAQFDADDGNDPPPATPSTTATLGAPA